MHVASNTSQQMKSARDLLFLHMRKMYCAYDPQCNTPKLQAIFLKAYCVAVAQSTTLVVIVSLQTDTPYHISLQFCRNTLGKKRR